MNTNTRDPQAPESYATFWEPIAVTLPHEPVPVADPKDAYQDFVNLTEGAPVVLVVEQI